MDTIKNFQVKDINMETLIHKNVTIVFLQWEQNHQKAKLSLNTVKINYANVNILVLNGKEKDPQQIRHHLWVQNELYPLVDEN